MSPKLQFLIIILAAIGAGSWYVLNQEGDAVKDGTQVKPGLKAEDPLKAAAPTPSKAPVAVEEESALPATERLKQIKAWAAQKDKKEAKEKLMALLKIEKDPNVRTELVRALGRMSRTDSEVIPLLTKYRGTDEADSVREAAVEALTDLGEDGRPAVEALTKMLDDDEQRLVALETLGEIGPFAVASTKRIAMVLQSKRVTERREALRVLRKIGVGSASVLGSKDTGIIGCLSDQDADVRAEAAKVLKRIGNAPDRPELKEALSGLRDDPDERVKRAAESAWQKLYGG